MIQDVNFWANSFKNTVLYRTQENICILVCGKSIFYYTVNNNQNVKALISVMFTSSASLLETTVDCKYVLYKYTFQKCLI